MPLTNKQESFASEYPTDNNATQAAIRAGYSPHTAQEQGSRLLSKVMVQEAIAKIKAEAMERNKTDVDLIDKMHKKAFDVSEEGKQGSAMTTAAMNLAKLHGLIIEKKEHDHIVEVKIQEGDGSL